jgi:Probable zinc-ribbon domain
MMEYSDLTITCKQCGKDFIFSEDEKDFYKARGFSTPQRCKSCRSKQRQSTRVCAQCGNSFVEGAPVYCAACLINQKLEPIRVEFASQMDSRLSAPVIENQKLLDEARNRAVIAEAAESKTSELLQQKAGELAELKMRLNLANSELEKAVKYCASLEKLAPALEYLKGKINVLENNQNTMAELLLQLSKKAQVASKNSLRETLRGFFRTPDSPAPSG